MRLKKLLKLLTFFTEFLHCFQSLLLTHLGFTTLLFSLLSYSSQHSLVISSSFVLPTDFLLEFLLLLLHALYFTDSALLIGACLSSLSLKLVSKPINFVSIELAFSSKVSNDSISSLLLSFHLFQIIILLFQFRLSIL